MNNILEVIEHNFYWALLTDEHTTRILQFQFNRRELSLSKYNELLQTVATRNANYVRIKLSKSEVTV